MQKEINEHDFITEWKNTDGYRDAYSISALRALYDYLTEYEDVSGTTYILDVVALACEYTEYSSALEAIKDYTIDTGKLGDVDTVNGIDNEELAFDYLAERTTVITFDDRMILSDGTIIGDAGILVAQF